MWYLIGFAYLLVGISVFRYIKEGGDKLFVALLWLFGWGLYIVFGILIYLVLPFVDLFKDIKNKCKTQH